MAAGGVWLVLLSALVGAGDALEGCPACSERRSQVVVTGRGGLSSRLSIYSTLSGVASSLCAHLLLPPPAEALAARYNHYKFVDPSITWDDLVSIRNPSHCSEDIIRVYHESSHDTTELREVNDIIAAMECKRENIPFVWTLHDEIIPTPKSNLLLNITHYIQNNQIDIMGDKKEKFNLVEVTSFFDMSPAMLRHASNLMKKYDLTPYSFTVVHIRRGDLKRMCNSDLSVMSDVLSNAFANCPFFNTSTKSISSQESNMPILLFSDENNVIYRSEVRRELREFGFHKVIDGDDIVRDYIEDELPDAFNNNYILFRIASALQMQTEKLIQLHGHHGCGKSTVCV